LREALEGKRHLLLNVGLPPAEAESSSAAQHRLAFEVLTEILRLDDNSKQLQELKQLTTEESYFGYGKISDNLMLQAFGQEYIYYFASDQSVRTDPIYDRHPHRSPILERIREALEGKRHLLLNVFTTFDPDSWVHFRSELRSVKISRK
jgi:hypothetical protein